MAGRKWFLLGLIVLVAGLVRLVWLDRYPGGFTPDEAAFGYNAYSLLRTGRDEWGTPFWQLPYKNLRSFGDYKMPLNAFLSVPSVALFGLNEFSTRLPNALLGTFSVLIVFLFSYRLFHGKHSSSIALVSAFFLALSPWAMPLSRGAFEANLITFFLPLAIYLYLVRRYGLSALFFALTLYTYHSARIVLPVVLLGLWLLYGPRISRKYIRFLAILFICSLPAAYSFLFANARAADVSILHPDDGWAAMATGRLNLINSGVPPFVARLIINKISHVSLVFLDQYAAYFSPRFLFFSGPAEATYGMLPGSGVLYLIQLPMLIGFFLAKKSKNFYFLLLLLLISPVPAALAKGPGLAANRAAFMAVPLTVISAIGLVYFIRNFHKFLFRTAVSLFVLITVFESGVLVGRYLTVSPLVHSRSMGYGFGQMTDYLLGTKKDYSRIRISRSLSEPHIYFAFYSQLDPAFYQTQSAKWTGFEALGFRFLDQYDGYTLGNIRFGNLSGQPPAGENTLFVGRPEDFPDQVPFLKRIYYPDQKVDIMISDRI